MAIDEPKPCIRCGQSTEGRGMLCIDCEGEFAADAESELEAELAYEYADWDAGSY